MVFCQKTILHTIFFTHSLQFLLFSDDWHGLVPKCLFALLAHIEAFFAKVKLAQRIIEVANATAR